MPFKLTTLIPALAAALLTSCSGVRYYRDYDPAADLAGVASWGWAGEGEDGEARASGLSSLDAERVERAIVAALGAKGVSGPADDADVRVRYGLTRREKVDVDAWSSGIGWYGPGYFPGGNLQYTVTERTVGTLTIDLVEPDGRLVWRGWAVRNLERVDALEPAEREELFTELVDGILEQFPPPATGS
ncbi:DUF4136 domain-containing protein [Engelhardtia mirabilis]|uniref:DUF4136 domain-containing protein n=1 Tax=Engelhardtia mirabilis TaxID=2528011 RepID=A0A518BDW5_9BACT|nr:hypothetical protein Pla133_02160 [Planctomycetes bacterium Pla133]QDU99478.1 hypothetical protein Pla86_02160 [Planctomycetes bacterium Pla86]